MSQASWVSGGLVSFLGSQLRMRYQVGLLYHRLLQTGGSVECLLIASARCDMRRLKCSAWTVRQSTNLWGQPSPDRGEPPETGLYLVYGALFALVKKAPADDMAIRTRFGSVLDDVERTVRVYRRDGVIARYKRYAVAKFKRPGAFVPQAGGVSALYSSHESHLEAKIWQMQRLQGEFPDLIRLKRGDVSAMSAPFTFIRSGWAPVVESDREEDEDQEHAAVL